MFPCSACVRALPRRGCASRCMHAYSSRARRDLRPCALRASARPESAWCTVWRLIRPCLLWSFHLQHDAACLAATCSTCSARSNRKATSTHSPALRVLVIQITNSKSSNPRKQQDALATAFTRSPSALGSASAARDICFSEALSGEEFYMSRCCVGLLWRPAGAESSQYACVQAGPSTSAAEQQQQASSTSSSAGAQDQTVTTACILERLPVGSCAVVACWTG